MGQCTDVMKAKMEGDSTYVALGVSGDVIGLLNLIHKIAYDYEAQWYPFLAVHSALKSYYAHFQKAHVTNDAYRESYINAKEVI